MTNQEIIEKEKMLNGIDCEAHTYAGWLQIGYRVKKGEKARFKTSIWNKGSKKQEDQEEGTNSAIKILQYMQNYNII